MVLDAARAILTSAGTLAFFWVLQPITPVLGIPLRALDFAGLAVAVGLTRRSELAGLARLLRRSPGA